MLLQAILELKNPPEDSYAWRNRFSLLQAQHLSLWESTANRPTNKRKAIVNVKNSFTFLYLAYESGDVCVEGQRTAEGVCSLFSITQGLNSGHEGLVANTLSH